LQYEVLPWILQQEVGHFQYIQNVWRPTDLLSDMQSRIMLKGVLRRYEYLSSAQDELASLDRGDVYMRLLRSMGINVRRAGYLRRSNQVAFIQVVSDFYSSFGKVLRLLKSDQLRGKFQGDSQ
jgi:hypothetical protein